MSITCYGSIIITSLGTDGVKIDCPDPVTISDGPGNMPLSSSGNGGGLGDMKPPIGQTPVKPATLPPATAAKGNPSPSSGGGGGGGGGTDSPSSPSAPPTGSFPDATPPTDFPEEPPVTLDNPPPPGDQTDVPPILEPPVETETVPPNGAPQATPEPASLTLLAVAGLGGLGYARRRRRD